MCKAAIFRRATVFTLSLVFILLSICLPAGSVSAESRPVVPEHTGNYLIIASPQVLGWLSAFIAYRSEDYTVRIASTADIGNTKEAVKAYIQQQYDNPATRPEYLLIASHRGDNDRTTAVPWYQGASYYTYETGNTDITSYNWYSLLAGSDLIPDVYMGIVFLNSQTEADNLLYKIRSTEANGYTNPNNAGFFMSLGYDNIASVYRPMAQAAGYSTFDYSIPDAGDPYVNANAFSELLDKNLKLFNLYGHGGPSGQDGITTYMANITPINNTVFPFMFSEACDLGNWFFMDETQMDVFPETMVYKTATTAVAMLANSHAGGSYSEILLREVLRSHMSDGVSQVGKLAHIGLLKLLNWNDCSATPFYAFNFEMVHLWGDPATEMNGRQSTRDKNLVHVVFGSGDGYFTAGQTVTIGADIPTDSAFTFERWAGDIEGIADALQQTTTLTVPDHDITVEAVYACNKISAVPGPIVAKNANARLGGVPAGNALPGISLALPGNWFNYEVDVAQSGKYTCRMHYSNLYKAGWISLRDPRTGTVFSSDELSVQSVLSEAGWNAWGTFFNASCAGTVNLPAGRHTLQIRLDSGTVEIDSAVLTLAEALPGLTVLKGSGTGVYTASTRVAIQADAPDENHVFDRWIGDVQSVENPESPGTFVAVADADVSIEAAYREIATGTSDRNEPFPNHFTVTCNKSVVQFQIPGRAATDAVFVKISLLALNGRRAAVLFDGFKAPGAYALPLNSNQLRGLASGRYICTVEAGNNRRNFIMSLD